MPRLLAGLFLVLVSSFAYSSESLDFVCSTDLLNTTNPITCINPATHHPIPENLFGLVTDLAKITVLKSDAGHCRVTDTGVAECDYRVGGNVIPLSCVRPTDNTIECRSPDFQDAVKLSCSFSVAGNKGCHFEFEKKDMVKEMVKNSLNPMHGNHSAIAETMISCAGEGGMDSEINWMCENVWRSVATGTNEAEDLLRAITPTKTDATMDVSHAAISGGIGEIRTRLNNVRNGIASTNSMNFKYWDGSGWHTAGTALAQNGSSANDSSPSTSISNYGRFGLFINGSYTDTEQETIDIENGHTAETTTLTFGADYRFSRDFIGGIAINVSQTDTEYHLDSGSLDNNNTTVIFYSSYYIDNWYIDGSINLGRDSYEQSRYVACQTCYIGDAMKQTYSSEFDGEQTAVSLSTGYNWHKGRFNITPFLEYSMASIETDAYTETASAEGENGASLALALSDQERDVANMRLGSNFTYIVNTNNGVFIPLMGLQLISELEDDSQVVTGNFIGNVNTSNTSFELETNEVDTSYFIVSAGFSFQLKNGNSGFLNIQSTEGYDNLTQTQYTAGWRFEF